jgi:Spy/CpxP family protein refolding chaperone
MVKTWQVVLGTIVIFVAGLVTGGAVTLRLLWVKEEQRKDQAVQAQAGPSAGRPPASRPAGAAEPQFGPALIRRFATQLDLTPAQFKRINPVVGRTQEELARLRREVQLGSALAIERMQDEIAAQLTPKQRGRFEELLRRQRARLQALIEERQHRLGPGPLPTGAPAAAGAGGAGGAGAPAPAEK